MAERQRLGALRTTHQKAPSAAFRLSRQRRLLAAQSHLDAAVLLEGSRIFTEFKGALTEQYVLQQLIASQSNPVFYWATEKGTAEVDFVLQRKQAVIPIEVKVSKPKV